MANFIFNSLQNTGLGVAYYWGEMWTPLFVVEIVAFTALIEYMQKRTEDSLADVAGIKDYLVLVFGPVVVFFYSTGLLKIPITAAKTAGNLLGSTALWSVFGAIYLGIFGFGVYSILQVIDQDSKKIKAFFVILNIGVAALICVLLLIAAAFTGS